MATCLFRSPLAFRLQNFLKSRRAAGCFGRSNEKILLYLDRFLTEELEQGETITQAIMERYVKSIEHLSVGTRVNRLSILRQFCLYLGHFDPRTCIVHRSFLPHRTRPAPYIYSSNEIQRIVSAARRIGPKGTLRPFVISTLIGLLYASGLRIGEALRLTLKAVDLERNLLIIQKTKFNKSRNVPISASTVKRLQIYKDQRLALGFSSDDDSPFFVNLHGRKYGQTGFTTVFLEILRSLNLRGPAGNPGPRVHDLRHTFAVNRLLRWYRQNVNLNAKLPLLSTYMGHSTISGTEVYLHVTAQLLEKTGQRFHSNFAVPAQR